MTWELDTDQPVAVPLRNGPQDLSDSTVERLFTSTDYAMYISEKNARVKCPQAVDIYLFKDVTRKNFKDVAKMDGYRFEGEGVQATHEEIRLPLRRHLRDDRNFRGVPSRIHEKLHTR